MVLDFLLLLYSTGLLLFLLHSVQQVLLIAMNVQLYSISKLALITNTKPTNLQHSLISQPFLSQHLYKCTLSKSFSLSLPIPPFIPTSIPFHFLTRFLKFFLRYPSPSLLCMDFVHSSAIILFPLNFISVYFLFPSFFNSVVFPSPSFLNTVDFPFPSFLNSVDFPTTVLSHSNYC